MSLEVSVNQDRCAGITMCVQFAPGVFALDESGQSTVVDPSGADRDTLVDAAGQCPMEAVTVVDGETGETLVPSY